MLVPLLGLAIGLLLLTFSLFVYKGVPVVHRYAFLSKFENNVLFIWGNISISLAAMLGIAGYWNVFQGDDLRLGRIVLLIVGITATIWSMLETLGVDHPLKKFAVGEKINQIGVLNIIGYILSGAAVLTLISIFGIAFFDYNYGGDAFMYHIPFAARIWGIIPPEQYTFEYFTENRFLGFPLLANWLQGLFWVVFNRIEATNLVAYFSLIILIFYLVKVPKIPFYLASLSLLAVPMVHMHAARSYIDLPGNVGVSICILTLYLLYIDKIKLDFKTLLILFLSAFVAANIKLQLIPVVFLLILASLPLFVTNYWRSDKTRQDNLLKLAQVFALGTLASLIIFYNPLKNIIVYQNPAYPVKITIAGQVLNHTEESPNFMHENIRRLPPPVRWGRSLLEINAFDDRRPWRWTLAMDFISWNEERFGMGGYFGGYVIFNVVLLAFLCWKNWQKSTKVALAFMLVTSAVTMWLPQSYELRYYMYWMIVFVSLNAYLVTRLAEQDPRPKNVIKPQYFGLVAFMFMIIFIHKTNKFFTYPAFQPLTQQLETADWMVKKEIFSQIEDGDQVCIVEKAPFSFFYNSYFHPGRDYSVRAEFNLEDERMKDKCEGLKILR
ncbi:hypothetical protein IQ219_05430 [Synechocystis sp. LEGE 06083]|uniref:hypothetical protein n=1 Tax=Synechocystis sp. LEGE 06083 TaxID=915336 RepID=UPI00187E4915|nr:hypothetical protein [Synechocystis sp. LEGE 06083]MBE9194760.1 hypothetical protein [Synechocystis sp. LEGE 06083]